jgi:predicted DNA-binding transcriptional regulator AlpA
VSTGNELYQTASAPIEAERVPPSVKHAPAQNPGSAKRQRNRREIPTPLREQAIVKIDQLATMLGVSKRQLFRWKAAGQLPPYDLKIGQTRGWWVSTVRAWSEARRSEAVRRSS